MIEEILYINIWDDEEFEILVEKDEDDVGDMDSCIVCGGNHYSSLHI